MRLSGRPSHSHKVDHFQLKTASVAFFMASTVHRDFRLHRVNISIKFQKSQSFHQFLRKASQTEFKEHVIAVRDEIT